jgi:predicted nucleic acid-binding protein
MQKVYLDANIYYNLWKDEIIRKVIPAGLYAELLFEKIKNEDFVLVVSDFLINLIDHNNTLFGNLLKEKISLYKQYNKVELVHFEEFISKNANQLLQKYKHKYPKVDWEDLVNFLLAKQAGAVLITRDEELLALANEEGETAVYPEDILKS